MKNNMLNRSQATMSGQVFP